MQIQDKLAKMRTVMDMFLKQVIKEAGQIAKDYFLKGVTFKTKSHIGDLITVADNAVSDFLIAKIQESYPDHGIYSEEQDSIINPNSDYLWMIDPIDGTRNFANAIPLWCNMVALFYKKELIMSALYNPLSDELFFAEKGKGATLNGMPIRVNDVDSFEYGYGAIVRGTYDMENPNAYQKEFARVSARIAENTTVWMHNYGTMLLAVYVATGAVDFYAANAGFDHDFAAPALICREAGALVTGIGGKDWERGMRDYIVANPKLHPKLLELFKD